MIEKKTVEHIANLARLEITDEEKEVFTREIGSILEHMDQLNEADTSAVEPTCFVAPKHDPLRDDIITDSLPVEKVLQNAPSVKGSFFAVPKIIQ